MRSGSLIDRWWDDEYAEDIHAYLLKREKRCIPYTMRSPQLPYRQYLMEILCTICDWLKLCISVKHLAAYMLDLFMDSYCVMVEHLQFVVLGCIVVAAKVDENDMLIPRMSELNAFVGNAYELKEFVNMEAFIMEFFNWDLLMPTVPTFLDYYSLHALASSDCYSELPAQSLSEAKNFIMNYVNYFLAMSLREVTFRLFSSSLVAASCVAASRICLGITPSWPRRLRDITHYSLSELKGCLEVMIRILEVERLSVLKQANSALTEDPSSCSSDEGGVNSTNSSICCSDYSPSVTDDVIR